MSSQTIQPRPERRIAINSGLLLLAYGFQALISLVIVGILARYLSQAGLGRYALIISFIELFTAFVDMGMNRILVREIAKDKQEATRLTSAVWTLRLLLSLVVFGVVALIAAGNGDRYLWLATMAFFIAQVVYLLGDVFAAMFQGYQRMEYSFWSIFIAQVVLLLTTLGVVWLDLGLLALFSVRILANGARLIYLWSSSSKKRFAEAHLMPAVVAGAAVTARGLPAALRAWRQSGKAAAQRQIDALGQRLVKRWDDARLAWHLFVESLPVGISLLLHGYIWRAGVVLTVFWLGQQEGDLVNGVLYGPLRAVQQTHIVPAAFAAALLPALSNRVVGRMDEFDTAFAKSIKLFTAMSLLMALTFTFLADPVVQLLLGDNIDLPTAARVLAWLGWVIVFFYLNWLYSATLVALGRQKVETMGLLIGLLLGIAVARWAIPRYLAMGVVYGILIAEGALFVVGTAALWRHFHWRTLLPSLAKLVVACGLAGLVFLAGSQLWRVLLDMGVAPPGTAGALLEVIVIGSMGLLGFLAGLLLLRPFDANEREGIRAMFRVQGGRR